MFDDRSCSGCGWQRWCLIRSSTLYICRTFVATHEDLERFDSCLRGGDPLQRTMPTRDPLQRSFSQIRAVDAVAILRGYSWSWLAENPAATCGFFCPLDSRCPRLPGSALSPHVRPSAAPPPPPKHLHHCCHISCCQLNLRCCLLEQRGSGRRFWYIFPRVLCVKFTSLSTNCSSYIIVLKSQLKNKFDICTLIGIRTYHTLRQKFVCSLFVQ